MKARSSGAPYNINTDIVQDDGTRADVIAKFCGIIEAIRMRRDVELRVVGHVMCVTGAMKFTQGGETTYHIEVSHDTDQSKAGGTKREWLAFDPVTNEYSNGKFFRKHSRFVVEYP